MRSFANHCEQLTSHCTNITRYYYADHNGMMITYPCYDDDPVYEDDQCTVNKILYDPRIKPVSDHLSKIIACINLLLLHNIFLSYCTYYCNHMHVAICYV